MPTQVRTLSPALAEQVWAQELCSCMPAFRSKETIMKNPQTQALVQELKKTSIEQGVKLWKRVAEDLDRPTRQRRVVNVLSIDKNAKDGEVVVVPGKVLAEGELTKKVTVAAFNFSDEARRKISSKGEAITIPDLMKKNPKAQKVRILG